MIKYIVFDFDGTLADTFETMKEIAKEEIKGITEEDFVLLKDAGIQGLMKRKHIRVWELSKMTLRIMSKLKNKGEVTLFPEMVELIKTISKTHKLGIVSSNSEESIKQTLVNHDIVGLFDFVFSEISLFGKHVVLKKMCREYQIKPSEIIYVGDEDRDITASQKNNIKNIAVTWGYNSKKRLKEIGPDYIVNSPEEIIGIIS